MTPAEAFTHIKALWPSATHINRHGDHHWMFANCSEQAPIDWPPGVTQWPMPEPPDEEPDESDQGKKVEVAEREKPDGTPEWEGSREFLFHDKHKGRYVCRAINSREAMRYYGWKYARRIKS